MSGTARPRCARLLVAASMSASASAFAAPALAVLAAGSVASATAATEQTTVVTFADGTGGWSGIGTIEPDGGNPDEHWRTINPDTFGLIYFNDTPAWTGDLSAFDEITVSTDVLVENIAFFGSPVSRSWIVEFRDYDDTPPGYPYVSVWYVLGTIAEGEEWETYSVTIDDPSATELPPGWGGTGAEDPDTFMPMLPPDRTFADVLAGTDEAILTTFEPGFLYGFTAFDIRLDNLAITTVSDRLPEDIDGDGVVGFDDLLAVLAAFGPCGDPGCVEDVDDSGTVDFDDLLAVLAAWTG